MPYPKKIFHWIENKEVPGRSKDFFVKKNPATGRLLAEVSMGGRFEVDRALYRAQGAFEEWSRVGVVRRGEMLRNAALGLQARCEELAQIVAIESGKSKKSALAEVGAAAECGLFFAGEGRRYEGSVLVSAAPNREVRMIREPVGVGALLTPFNNPSAGIAWKLFPALLCGNAVVIKSHSDTPYVGVWYGKLLKEFGFPSGLVSVLQGSGEAVGAPLVADRRIKFVSLTGSVATGQAILKAAADRLAKVSIEAGGKNPFIVCDDADLERAASLAVTSAFVDAGQRCAAASRLIVFDRVYERFKKLLLEKIGKLRVGTADADDYGAVIREERMTEILKDVEEAVSRGADLLWGGYRLSGAKHKNGYFIAPTVLENVSSRDPISKKEIFGPVTVLYRVRNFREALRLANSSEFKLTGTIHTQSIHRAQEFIREYRAGVARVNGPTHGSEPHMPFGGSGLSGNGWREPGTKALDFYSEWKQVSVDHDPELV